MVLRSRDVRGFTQAFNIPTSWQPRRLHKKEFMATIKGDEVAKHVDNLRAGFRLPLHLFKMQFLKDEILSPA